MWPLDRNTTLPPQLAALDGEGAAWRREQRAFKDDGGAGLAAALRALQQEAGLPGGRSGG
jgi:hypothetical protein